MGLPPGVLPPVTAPGWAGSMTIYYLYIIFYHPYVFLHLFLHEARTEGNIEKQMGLASSKCPSPSLAVSPGASSKSTSGPL